jgi:isopentenyldiphosphate isomerase
MLVDVVNANDTPVGVIARRDVFREHVNFRVVHELIFNSRGELLIQKLASTHPRHPGYWGSSVAGYLFAGESYEAAAKRRLIQELGVTDVSIDFVGKTSMDDEGCRKFIAIFSSIHNGPFEFNRDYIEQLEFLPLQQIHAAQRTGTRLFTPTFLRVLAFYENRIQ